MSHPSIRTFDPRVSFPCLLLLASTLAACGGSGSDAAAIGTLERLSIGPPSPRVPIGFRLQLEAIGSFSDGSERDVTAEVVWQTSDPAIASVGDVAGTKGLAEGVALGTVTITVSQGEIADSASLEVVTPVMNELAVTPPDVAVRLAGTQQFTATAFFAGGFSADVTADASWSSSDESIATVSGSGRATARAVGECDVSASFDGFTDVARLRAIEVAELDGDVPLAADASVPVVANGATDTTFAVWSYRGQSPGEVYAARYAGGAWGAKESLDDAGGVAFAPTVVANAAGQAMALWATRTELRARRFLPGSGWTGAAIVEAGADGSTPFAQDVRLVMGDDGAVLAVWRDRDGTEVRTSRFQDGPGWDLVQVLGNTNGVREPVVLVGEPAGDAFVLWQYFDDPSASIVLVSTRFDGTIWWGPEPIHSAPLRMTPDAALDAAGNLWAAWIEFVPAEAVFNLLAARRAAGISGVWEPAELVSDAGVPKDPRIATSGYSQALAVWRHAAAGGTALSTSRFVEDEGWTESEVIEASSGPSLPQRPILDADGNAAVLWTTDSFEEGRRVEWRELWAGAGWQPARDLTFMGSEGLVRQIEVGVDDSGQVAVAWNEDSSAESSLFAFRFQVLDKVGVGE